MLKTNGVDLMFCSREGSKINLREKRLQHEMSSDKPVLQQRGEQVREEERTNHHAETGSNLGIKDVYET